ncbi:hypothetical protein Tco_1326281 [Tanacetum coccineum]
MRTTTINAGVVVYIDKRKRTTYSNVFSRGGVRMKVMIIWWVEMWLVVEYGCCAEGQQPVEVWRVRESGSGDRVDPLMGITFGIRRKNPAGKVFRRRRYSGRRWGGPPEKKPFSLLVQFFSKTKKLSGMFISTSNALDP